MIHVRNLSKTFRTHRKEPGLWASVRSLVTRPVVLREAVREVSFDVGEGEILGIVGANGAGKTTIVKMLAGVIHPTAGDAEVLGFRPWERDARFLSRMALVMGQKAQLWWDLPAGDGFLLLREIYRIPWADYRRRLDELAGLLDVTALLGIPVRRLSLGERMKLELIAALLHAPRVVYLDEPTIGLDLTAQRAIRGFLLEYLRLHRPALILTSHYMEDIERLCRRILILREGRIVYDGSLARVVSDFAGPKTIAVRLHASPDASRAPRADDPDLTALGEVLAANEEEIRLRVTRDRVARTAGQILARYPVADLSIEEPDIGEVIERIQTRPEGTA